MMRTVRTSIRVAALAALLSGCASLPPNGDLVAQVPVEKEEEVYGDFNPGVLNNILYLTPFAPVKLFLDLAMS